MKNIFPKLSEKVFRSLQVYHGYGAEMHLLISKKNRTFITQSQLLQKEGGCSKTPGATITQLTDKRLKLAKQGLVIRGFCLTIPEWMRKEYMRDDCWMYVYDVTGKVLGYGGTLMTDIPMLIMTNTGTMANWYKGGDYIIGKGFIPYPAIIVRRKS